MNWACQIDWAEARWWVQPLVTAIGIGFSVWVAVTVPRWNRQRERKVCADATSHVLESALARVADRVEIRFDPGKYVRDGRKLRQDRANATLTTLLSLKIEDLPIRLVPAFSEARSALHALNQAMNAEPHEPWPPVGEDLLRYKRIYVLALGATDTLNEVARELGVREVAKPGWVPLAERKS